MGWKRRYRYKYIWGCLQITFRLSTDGKIDVRIDDGFAILMGYMDARGIVKNCKAFKDATNTEWARVEKKGKVYLYKANGLSFWKKIEWFNNLKFD